jgi:hypothetical protein
MEVTGSDVVATEPTLKSSVLVGKPLRLTDARQVGIMLRDDGHLTLRNHSALTTMLAEPVDDTGFKLHVTAYEGNNYVGHDGTVFKADKDGANAVVFHAKQTALGIELYFDDERPAVFDRHFDVGVGPWTPTCKFSQIPILIWWGPLSLMWQPQSALAMSTEVSVGPSSTVVPGVGAKGYPFHAYGRAV